MPSKEWSPESKQRFSALIEDRVWAKLSCVPGGISQEKFGAFFGVRGTTVQNWLKGSIPDTPTLAKIAGVLGWTLDDIFFYLQSGVEPGEGRMEKLSYMIKSLPIPQVESVINIAVKRIASEAQGQYS